MNHDVLLAKTVGRLLGGNNCKQDLNLNISEISVKYAEDKTLKRISKFETESVLTQKEINWIDLLKVAK